MSGEAARPAPDERRFYAVATWTLPAAATALPVALLLSPLDSRGWLVILGLAVAVALVAVRAGRQVVGGLVLGALLGLVALLVAAAVGAALEVLP